MPKEHKYRDDERDSSQNIYMSLLSLDPSFLQVLLLRSQVTQIPERAVGQHVTFRWFYQVPILSVQVHESK